MLLMVHLREFVARQRPSIATPKWVIDKDGAWQDVDSMPPGLTTSFINGVTTVFQGHDPCPCCQLMMSM
jgi:hypothetical protein